MLDHVIVRAVTAMLTKIHTEENREAEELTARDVVIKVKAMRLNSPAERVDAGIHENFSCFT